VVAALFVVAGGYLGSALGTSLGIQYLEVRPSFSTTLDIAGATYRENALLGIGPNRFEDAWRLYKNPVINETLFWNTTFAAGSGYVPTVFVTMGLVGGILLLIFLGALCVTGYRMLAQAERSDEFWYFVATASFAGALYLWGMAFVYVPGTTMLLLAAFWTGLCLVAYAQLVPSSPLIVSFTQNRARAFILIATVMVIIIAAVGTLFVMGTQYAAHVLYARTVANTAVTQNLTAADAALAQAFQLFGSDLYLTERVQLRVVTLSTLLNAPTLSVDEQQRFQTSAIEAVQLAREAVRRDETSPRNHALLGTIYGVLAITGVSDAQPLAEEAFMRAKSLDPQNPEYALIEAQIATRLGDIARARERALDALTIKRNYVDALYLLTQLDVADGNAESAVATARAIVGIEPQNPARYFQLATLLLANQDLDAAAAAFREAIRLDQGFANARYLLALILIEQGDVSSALDELRQVLVTNADNSELRTLITALESGEAVAPALGITPPVSEPGVSVNSEGVTTTNEPPQTNLIVPINRSSGSAVSPSVPPADTANDEALLEQAPVLESDS